MIEAQHFVDCAQKRGFAFYAGVPCSLLTPFIDHVIESRATSYLPAANEGDAVAAAAGAALGGVGAVVMMQNSGLGNAVSPLSSLTWVFRIPLLLVVTWRGEPGTPDEPQHRLMGAITPALLQTLEIPWEPFPLEPEAVEPALARACAHLERERRPFALLMGKGAVAARAPRSPRRAARPSTPTLVSLGRGAPPAAWPSRGEALRRIVEATRPERSVLIATTGYTGRELCALADRSNQLYMVGSMGCASSLGLGLALARPDWEVVVIDGDGAALMRMGNVATLGAHAGANLAHLVLDNECHESTGGQETASSGVAFARIASACGYGAALEGDHLGVLDALFSTRGAGPRFAHLKIRRGTPGALPRPHLSPEQVAKRFATHLGAAPSRSEAPT